MRLGTAIRLEAYEARQDGGELLVDLYWRSEAAPEADYTVFLHWVDAAGVLVAQDDGPPAGGAYPTSWWLAGDVIRDRHTLTLDDLRAPYTLRVGMYVPATGERLPAVDVNGVRLPDDAFTLQGPE